MGKKMAMRGRPGLFFITILIIFLVIFFLTWKSMMTPKRKTDIKDVYSMNAESMNLHSMNQFKQNENKPVDMNAAWHRVKSFSEEKPSQLDNERDEDYNFRNSVRFVPAVSGVKKTDVISPLSNHLHPKRQSVETKPYYKQPNDALKIIGGRMERFIHLDLKGAAPKLSYFKTVLPLFSRLGATGLLIEYEDMFPYSGRLQNVSAKNCYTEGQIKELLDLAKLNSLKVIPLIQTFGHMEFVLKSLNLKGLRESEYTPQVIDITTNMSYSLLQEMVDQMLQAHPETEYLHVGCDEVYELGKGKSADIIIKEKISPEKLFMRHVKRVAEIVAKSSQNKVRPIIWDDELRKMPEEDIKTAGLPSSVDIMVWRYTQNVSDILTEQIWNKYGRLFKTIWAASSFKGATGARQLYTEPQHHIINHFSWLDVVAKYGHSVTFKGIALTGWQRFDHFATLCELMPVAVPSLAVCLASIRNGGFNEEVHKATSALLGCSGMIEMSFPILDKKERKALISQDCRFPGHMVYYSVQQLWGYKQFVETDRRSGWLSDYQIKHGFSSPGQLSVMSRRLFELQAKLTQTREPLEKELLEIYSPDTVEEWLDENIFEMTRQLKELQEKIKTLNKNTHWARRPHAPVRNVPFVSDDGVGTGLITDNQKPSNPHKTQITDVRGIDTPNHFISENDIPNVDTENQDAASKASLPYVTKKPILPGVVWNAEGSSRNNNHDQEVKNLTLQQRKTEGFAPLPGLTINSGTIRDGRKADPGINGQVVKEFSKINGGGIGNSRGNQERVNGANVVNKGLFNKGASEGVNNKGLFNKGAFEGVNNKGLFNKGAFEGVNDKGLFNNRASDGVNRNPVITANTKQTPIVPSDNAISGNNLFGKGQDNLEKSQQSKNTIDSKPGETISGPSRGFDRENNLRRNDIFKNLNFDPNPNEPNVGQKNSEHNQPLPVAIGNGNNYPELNNLNPPSKHRMMDNSLSKVPELERNIGKPSNTELERNIGKPSNTELERNIGKPSNTEQEQNLGKPRITDLQRNRGQVFGEEKSFLGNKIVKNSDIFMDSRFHAPDHNQENADILRKNYESDEFDQIR